VPAHLSYKISRTAKDKPMPATIPAFVRLDGPAVSLVLAFDQGVPAVLWWGPRLDAGTTPEQLAALAARAEANASPAVEPALALTPQAGQGGPGRPGLAATREGRGWASLALVEQVDADATCITITSRDAAHGLALVHRLALDGDVLVATTMLTNEGDAPLDVAHLAAPLLPLPGYASDIIGFEGRWAGEFATVRKARQMGQWARENRRGRTSHDAFPGLIACEAATTESSGIAWGFHLGWSGNHRTIVETLADGRASVAMEALYLPGEVQLAAGETLATPALYASVSAAGLAGLSQAFHRHLRARPAHARLRARARPVHYNSWEAVYFDHDPAVLAAMATRAAALGVERFVLDDGWFKGRRHDRAGLGDWVVDTAVWPDGLGLLAAHVTGLGMEFGLWVEPEMVNPDSDLYRAHPDWVLATPPAPQLGFRHQLVLDCGRDDVQAHLLARIDALLRSLPITYLKWDMNRDISHPGRDWQGGQPARPGAVAHVHGVYAMLDRLRAAHPDVEIESCASGGGRADYGVLARTDRIWTSDSNDAIDRLAIQRGFSHFFPAELMGAHVGPATCHITGRRLPMALRVATALFGHMGVEMDLRDLSAAEADELAAGIALHKAHRGLIHTGDLVRLDSAAEANAFMIVAADRSEALFSYTQVTPPRGYFAPAQRLAGLDPAARYRLRTDWPRALRADWPLAGGGVFSGQALMQAGFQPPRVHPATALVMHLQRV
jgi:alpha-galactosidase